MTPEGYPNPPDRFIVNTGEGGIIEKEKIRFFEELLDFLGYDQRARGAFAEIIPMMLHRYDSSGQVRPTDDRITLLIIRDHITASVLERRNGLNWLEVAFASYLNPEVIQKLKQGL